MTLTLADLRGAFEGVFPATVATTASDGEVNLVFISQVHYVDAEHVALSEQFLKRTLANLEANPRAQTFVVDPTNGRQYRLDLRFLRRETEGPLVARMGARLEAIAAATGVADIFRLRAALVFRVLAVRPVLVKTAAAPAVVGRAAVPGPARFGELAAGLAAAPDLETLADELLSALANRFGYTHVALWLADGEGSVLAVGSRGFEASGIGAEVAVGAGLVGQCAATRQAIRVSALSRERTYARAADPSLREIVPPTLPDAESFLAVPLVLRDRIFGVVAVESHERLAFDDTDQETLSLVAHLAGSAMALLEPSHPSETTAPPVRVRIYEEDDSVFIDDEYIVKGTAGRLLGVLLALVEERGNAAVTNRELRLDPRSRLSSLNDNLEARLLMLRRRLEERSPRLRVVSVGRGRLKLEATVPYAVERIRE